jgi:hypothetical protein
VPAEVSTDTTAVAHPATPEGRARLRHRRLAAWITFGLLFSIIGSAVVDGADMVDVWGVDEGVARATGADGARLSVRYPTVTRPALASPFEIVVRKPGGFDADVDVAVDLDYLELWDLNAVYPSPSDEQSDGERIVWTFAAPARDTLKVSVDARVEPGAQLEQRRGSVSLLAEDAPELTVRFATRVMP